MKFIKTLFITALITALIGCAPSQPMAFGIPQAQFNKLSPQQRQAVIARYNKDQADKAEFSTILDAAAAIGGNAAGPATVASSYSHSCHSGSCSSSGSSVQVGIS